MDYDNNLNFEQKKIAEVLKIQPSQVSRTIKFLLEKGILEVSATISKSKHYRISAHYAWKGTSQAMLDRKTKNMAKSLDKFRSKKLTVVK